MKKLTLIGCTLGLLISHTVHANEAPLQGTLKKIADSGSITLGYRDASVPFSYVGDNSGKPMGYSVELANKIVERVQQQVGGKPLKIKYNLVTSQTRIPLVQNGTVDLECGSTGVTAERQKQVAFSYGFIYVKGQLLTAAVSVRLEKGRHGQLEAGVTSEHTGLRRFLRDREPGRAAGQIVIGARGGAPAPGQLEAVDDLAASQQEPGRDSLGRTDHVGAGVHAVREVGIQMTGLTVHTGVAGGASAERVRAGVNTIADIGLHLGEANRDAIVGEDPTENERGKFER